MLIPRTKTHWSYVITDVSTHERSHGPRNGVYGHDRLLGGRNKRLPFPAIRYVQQLLLATASVPRAYLKGQVSLGEKPGHKAARRKINCLMLFFPRTLNRASSSGNLLFLLVSFSRRTTEFRVPPPSETLALTVSVTAWVLGSRPINRIVT